MSRTGDDTPTVEGAFIRIRALGHAVAYAGVRVQEGTTAAETIELVATKLRMSEDERLSKRLVCAYPVERRSARQPLDQPLDVNSTYVMSNPLKLSSAPAAFQSGPGAPGRPQAQPPGGPPVQPGASPGQNYWSVSLQPSSVEEAETVDMADGGRGLLGAAMAPNNGPPAPPPSPSTPPAPPSGLPTPPAPPRTNDDSGGGADEASRQRAIELVGDPMLGSVLAETYDFQKLLGKGAMGKVFLAHHRDLDKACAVKLTQPKGRMAEEVIQRFKREILVTSLITHPNVVEVYDAEEMPDGTYVMAMEVLEGEELKAFLKRKGPLPPLLCYCAPTPATTATAAHLVLKTILGSSLVTEPRKCHCACSKGALATWQLSAWSAASGCVMKATW
mgnify:CR=1 FL=1